MHLEQVTEQLIRHAADGDSDRTNVFAQMVLELRSMLSTVEVEIVSRTGKEGKK